MLKNIYKDVIKDFGTRTFNDIQSRATEIKANNKFSLLTEDIQNYIDDVTADKVVMISETTKKDIKRIVAKAIEEGKSIPETEMMIDGLYLDQIIPNRSKTIARTEVVSASNYGSIAGAKQTTSKLNKIWIPTFDDSTRESHLAMANHPPIALDAMFNVGGFYGQQPGDFALPASEVINCRCAIGYDYAPVVQMPPQALPLPEVQPRKISIEELDNYEELLKNLNQPNYFYGNGKENLLNKALFKKLGYDGKPNVVNTETLNKYIEETDLFGYRGLPKQEFVESLKRGEYFSGTGYFGSGTYSTIINKKTLREFGIIDDEKINELKKSRYGTAWGYAGKKDEGVSKFALSKTFKYATFEEMTEKSRNLIEENENKLREALKNFNTKDLIKINESLEGIIEEYDEKYIKKYIRATRRIKGIEEIDKLIVKLYGAQDVGTLAILEGYDGLYIEGKEFMVIFNRTKMIIDEETGKKWRVNNGAGIK
jgi:hypothetical protein